MRITTQMVNETARKAGVPINNTSLLNHINGGSDGDLLKVLNKGKSSAENTKQKSNYEKLEKEADGLKKKADSLAAKGDDSLYAKARESGDTAELCKEAQELVESFNNTMKILQSSPESLNKYYAQMLREAAEDNSEVLAAVGITISKDGKAAVDSDKLKAADVDTLEKALGSSNDFTAKVSFLAGRISDNAQAGVESLSSQYGRSGDLLSSVGGKYSFWG